MKLTINKPVDFEVKFLKVDAGVRYWEDTKVNGAQDADCEETDSSPTIPCAEYIGDKNHILRGNNWRWRPIVDIETGQIINWTKGISADVHYKVCDDGIYTLLDGDDNEIVAIDGYVPDVMCPADDGYGDYIIMNIDENGFIHNWKKNLIKRLIEQEED